MFGRRVTVAIEPPQKSLDHYSRTPSRLVAIGWEGCGEGVFGRANLWVVAWRPQRVPKSFVTLIYHPEEKSMTKRSRETIRVPNSLENPSLLGRSGHIAAVPP